MFEACCTLPITFASHSTKVTAPLSCTVRRAGQGWEGCSEGGVGWGGLCLGSSAALLVPCEQVEETEDDKHASIHKPWT